MDLPSAIDPEEILSELIEGIAIDAESADDATRIADELLTFLRDNLNQVDWSSEIENAHTDQLPLRHRGDEEMLRGPRPYVRPFKSYNARDDDDDIDDE